jgi:hypothetical protein
MIKSKVLLLFCLLGSVVGSAFADPTINTPGGKPTISGYIKDAANGEALIGATVYIKEIKSGTSSNIYGYYSVSADKGKYTLVYSYVGYVSKEIPVDFSGNIKVDVELTPESTELQEVVVKGERANANVSRPEMSVAKLEMKSIKQIPALMGEVDVIKAIQMLPGVQSTSEGSSGFSVRGGSSDQNQIMLDEAVVFNASHLMGFFSVFNNDAIKDVRLYKGDIPAMYGGKLSSVLDVRMKDGNSKKFSGVVGIGIISSRATFEGPIIKDKTSFIVSGRRTYADLALPLAKDPDIRKNKLYFYDFNMKVNHTFNDNNRLYISGYFGQDVFKSKFAYFGFGNQTLTARWNHLFSSKLFLNTSLIYSSYSYELGTEKGRPDSFKWRSDLKNYSTKLDFTYYVNNKNTLRFGAISSYQFFDPATASGVGSQSLFDKYIVPRNFGLEHAIYASNEQTVNDWLTLKYGVRFSGYQRLGTATIQHYDKNYIKTGETFYSKRETVRNYFNWEPRVGAQFMINDNNSVKASYSRTVQYLHLASNSNAGTPLDVWFPSGPNVKPQLADQYAVGYFRNLFDNMIETSAELYYKDMRNVVDFKDNAELFLNKEMEGQIRIGKSYSYGAEAMVKVNGDKINGWVSYTYSRTQRKINGVNNDKWFPAFYDKPHNVNVVLSYDVSPRVVFGANWIFATGAPMTVPVGRIVIDNDIIPVYSARNAYRMPDYHRLDISITIKSKKKVGRKWDGELNISMYNAYGRKNPWAINFVVDKDNPNVTYAEKTYLFTYLPSITYNIKF